MEYADFSNYWQPLLGGQGPVGTYSLALNRILEGGSKKPQEWRITAEDLTENDQ
jgi:hypothetical protein